MSTVETVLKEGTKMLKSVNISLPRLDAEVILSNLLDVPRINLIIDKDLLVSEDVIEIFKLQINRRVKGEPVAYIIGKKEFMGLDFLVDKNVIIPRPDTEVLVEYVIKMCTGREKTRLIDVGTGSGAIGLSVAKYVRNVSLVLVDVSKEALKIARENYEKLEIKSNGIEYVLSDCFDRVEKQKFDVIVSNPPYIPSADIKNLQIEVSGYEPHNALDGGSDGLDFYRRIASVGKSYLAPEGLMAFEIGYDQAEEVTKILLDNGYTRVEKLKDYSGHARVIGARL